MIIFVAMAPAIFYLLLFKKNSKYEFAFYSITFLIYSYALLQGASRGHEIALFLSLGIIVVSRFIYHIHVSKRLNKKVLTKPFVISCLVLFIVFVFGLIAVIKSGILVRLFSGDAGSDAVRLNFISEVIPQLFSFPILLGKGFGFTIESAVYWHIEMSLLEIFLKQGLIGFLIWIAPIYILAKSINKNKNPHLYWFNIITIANLYLTSVFNPYLNCYLGTSMIVVLLACDYSECAFEKSGAIATYGCKKVIVRV